MSTVSTEKPEAENNHLAEEHGLIKTTAYIRSRTAKQRSAGADRVARHRQQKKEKGIIQVDLPISVAEEIKAAGSFDAWMKQFQRLSSEKIRKINLAIQVANKVSRLHPWLRWILNL